MWLYESGALIEAQTLGLVHSALEGLPERFRTPLMLRFIENLPYEEIGQHHPPPDLGSTTASRRFAPVCLRR